VPVLPLFGRERRYALRRLRSNIRETTMRHLHHDRERGAAAVELAIVLPILVLLVFGIIQWSIYFNRLQGLQAAAREGARVAALPQSTNADVKAKVSAALNGVLPSGTTPTITISPSTSNPCDLQPAGSSVTVTVTTNTNLDIPLWGSQTVTQTGKGVFKCE
jgi:Flp pilus assembly protein TadG